MPDEPKVCGRCGGSGSWLWGGPYLYWHGRDLDCFLTLKARVDALEMRVAVRQDVAVGPTEGQ